MSDPYRADAGVLEIGFDPESVLSRDSRVMLDPIFLATLRHELALELSEQDSALALLQMGFLHGLQDAVRMLAAPPSGTDGSGSVFAPPLRMPCRRNQVEGSATLGFDGSWPESPEAQAQRSMRGTPEAACCHLSAGYTSGWLSGMLGADLLALETHCGAGGAPGCRFVAREASAWLALDVPEAQLRLDALPFDAFRALVRERVARTAMAGGTPESRRVDRSAVAVHIWGPVMVIPWAGADATLHTLDMLARDEGAADVSVIVLDLQRSVLDDAQDALALEQLVQTASTWGTEVLFVDPAPLSEAVLADLEPPPLLVLKDLDPAVALAFQIARSQRRLA